MTPWTERRLSLLRMKAQRPYRRYIASYKSLILKFRANQIILLLDEWGFCNTLTYRRWRTANRSLEANSRRTRYHCGTKNRRIILCRSLSCNCNVILIIVRCFQSENDSNDDEYSQKSPVLQDLDESTKKQQQRLVGSLREASTSRSGPSTPLGSLEHPSYISDTLPKCQGTIVRDSCEAVINQDLVAFSFFS